MVTESTRLIENVRKFGPAAAADIHGLRLPEFVATITGIDTTYCVSSRNEDITSRTNQAEGLYHESGLAVESFPTFWHRYLANLRADYENHKRKCEKKVREYIDKIPGDTAQGTKRKKVLTDRLERDVERRKQWDYGDTDYQKMALSGGEVYNNYKVDAALVGQWRENEDIVEVYTAGGHDISCKGYRPRLYSVYRFNKEKELVKIRELPFRPFEKLPFFGILLYVCTLSTSSMVIDGISIPFKRSLERNVFKKAQKNWERHKN